MAYPISRCRFPDDVSKIIKVAAAQGVIASALEAETAWEEASDDACAQWLTVSAYSDEVIWKRLPNWFKGEYNQEEF